MKNVISVVMVSGLLSACSMSSVVKNMYPDYKPYSFYKTDENSEVYRYLCKPGATEAETSTRARAAHQFTMGALTVAAKTMISDVFDKPRPNNQPPSTWELYKGLRRMSAQGSKIGETLEKQYQCVMLEAED